MLRHEVDQVMDGLNVFEEHMSPVYREISDAINQGLGLTAVANSLEAIQQADINKNLLCRFVDLLPQAKREEVTPLWDGLIYRGYNEKYKFSVDTLAQVRWLQKNIAWLTPIHVAGFKEVDVSKPYYVLGHKIAGSSAELLLVDAAEKKIEEDDDEIERPVIAVKMSRRQTEKRQKAARASLRQPIDRQEMEKLYEEDDDGNKALMVRSNLPNTQRYYDKNLKPFLIFSGLFSLYIAPAIKALHPYGISMQGDFNSGVYDSDLRDYHVFDRVNELAVSFDVADKLRELLGSIRNELPAITEGDA